MTHINVGRVWFIAAVTALAGCSQASIDNAPGAAGENASAEAPAVAPAMANPFEAEEAEMKASMMAAVGSTADQTWAMKMMAHHQGAIAMARTVLGKTDDADIRRMAQKTVDMQTKEVSELEAWLSAHGGRSVGDVNPFAEAERKMHDAMMAAMGSDASQTWARKMRAHHQGAIDVSELVLASTKDAKIREMAGKVVDMQRKDIAELDRWLASHGG